MEDKNNPYFPTVSGGDSLSPDAYYNVIYTAVNDALIAQNVTDGQNIPDSALSYFEGILQNARPFTDYVCYVGDSYQYWWGQNSQTAYEYCMAYGDLDCNGTLFTGKADIVKLRVVGENSVSYQIEQSVSINAPMFYSRSNLGAYSGIVEKDYTGICILVALLLGGVTWFVRKLLQPSQ